MDVTLGRSMSQLINLSVPKITIKRQANYFALQSFQQDHETPSKAFTDIFDQNSERPDGKSTEHSDTTDDKHDTTNSREHSNKSSDTTDTDTTTDISKASSGTELSTDFTEHQHVARSRKPLRNSNKNGFCDYDNQYELNLIDSTNGDYVTKLHGGNANNFIDKKLLQGSGIDSYFTKGMSYSNFLPGPDSSSIDWRGSHSYSQHGGDSKPINWEGSHSGNAGGEMYASNFNSHDGSYNYNDYNLNGGEESYSNHDWDYSNTDSNSGHHSSNYHQHFGENAHDDYTKKNTMGTHNEGTWNTFHDPNSPTGQYWEEDVHKRHRKKHRHLFNYNNNNNDGGFSYFHNNHNNNDGGSGHFRHNNYNNNNGKFSRIIHSNFNYNNGRSSEILSNYNNGRSSRISNSNNGRSSKITDMNEFEDKKKKNSLPNKLANKKKKLSLISFNSINTNNNINNNNNADGAVNYNNINNGKTGQKLTTPVNGQSNCWFVVCLGLYVNEPKLSQFNQNKSA